MNGNYFALYVYTVVYGRGLCLQVMHKFVDSEGLAKMFDVPLWRVRPTSSASLKTLQGRTRSSDVFSCVFFFKLSILVSCLNL